jgi:phosphohistidine phosphatase
VQHLLVIRHALAVAREEFARTGRDDALRPVTAEGARTMRRAAAGLARIIPGIDLLASSPFVRTAQTAGIVAAAYGGLDVRTVDVLAPGGSQDDILRWLHRQREARAIALVGHEPDLGALVSWLLADVSRSFVELKKGAACLLRFQSRPAPGRATLRWALAPAQLRRVGRG